MSAVHLVDEAGTVRGADVSDADGSLDPGRRRSCLQNLVVSNLPAGYLAPEVFGRSDVFVLGAGSDDRPVGRGCIGHRHRDARSGSSGASTALVVADGDASEVGPAITAARSHSRRPPGTRWGCAVESGMGSWLVVVLATLIGVSVLAGSLRPAAGGAAKWRSADARPLVRRSVRCRLVRCRSARHRADRGRSRAHPTAIR
ncbi:MAG: hypothetical protein R2713_11465 [Ilumatobacteraceae bacterium]